jgi:hypothetical protein
MTEGKRDEGKMPINSYDLDGVVSIGITPNPRDIIITGRSFEEAPETYHYLHDRGIYNPVFFQPCLFDCKTRVSSGEHKGVVLHRLIENGVIVDKHFEDDEEQIAQIRKYVDIPIVHLVHNLTERENIRRLVEKSSRIKGRAN